MDNTTNNIINNLHNDFRELYEKEPSIYYSPGRVNLIGEHTDYNCGFVMPFAINMGTYIAIAKRDDDLVRVYSKNLNEKKSFILEEVQEKIINSWDNYIKGVFNIIAKDYGKKIQGVDIYIYSDLPFGAGLSSSASLATALAFAYNNLLNLGLKDIELATAAQQVEHRYIGTNCGLLDQMACILSKEDMTTMIDCNTYEHKNIPLNLEELTLLIVDTNIKHNLAESAYNDRRKTCENIARFNNIKSLRELNIENLTVTKESFSKDDYSLAKHIYTENQRVLDAAKAMKDKNWKKLGELMYQSHYSLKDDYKVSCNELDYLVVLSESFDGVHGARMTGGGFGGSTIHLVPKKVVEEYKAYLEKNYYDRFKIKPLFYMSKACNGTHKI
ncbi:galactokinase [Francisella adeliensis]|nr:galactokinase [Francisella adeliensis]